MQLVKRYLYETDPPQFIRFVKQIGWHAGTFVFPDFSIGPPGGERVLFYAETQPKHKYRTAGTLDEWQQNIGCYCRGNSRLLFSCSVAFASALLEIVKADNCGFHLRDTSSVGKTTSQRVGGSVWGGDSTGVFL